MPSPPFNRSSPRTQQCKPTQPNTDIVCTSKQTTIDNLRIDAPLRLQRAIHLNDPILVRRILTSNPSIIQSPDFSDESNTSLHLAARLGHVEICKLLISRGHESERISRNTAGLTPLLAAVDAGHESAAEMLSTCFPRCLTWKDANGRDALMYAARTGCAGLISSFLAKAAEDRRTLLEAADKDGNQALHFASANGHLKCAMVLLQAGADPNARNVFSWMPVSYSSTVSAEVYYKQMVAELEKRKGVSPTPVSFEEERRKEAMAGLRVVTPADEEEWVDPGPDAVRQALSAAEASTGRSSPVGLRSPGRTVLAGRMRAGSAESRGV